MRSTAGTKIPATLSAILAMGALVDAASSHSLITAEMAVSSPTFSARHLRYPLPFAVAHSTASPTVLSLGINSPVSAASEIWLSPSSTTPSQGTRAPGLSMKISPSRSSEIGMLSSFPSRSTKAVLGARLIRERTASVVLCFAPASRSFPTVMRVTIIAADSK